MTGHDLGDPPEPRYSIINELRRLVPGRWAYRHPQQWLHESGLCVYRPLDAVNNRCIMVRGESLMLAMLTEDGWQWRTDAGARLRILTGRH